MMRTGFDGYASAAAAWPRHWETTNAAVKAAFKNRFILSPRRGTSPQHSTRKTSPRRMQRFSLLSLLQNSFSGHTEWKPFWRDAAPKARYDAVIIGGGGHGLATAYYLAKNHGITNVAVLEK